MSRPWTLRGVLAALALIVMPWLLHAQPAQIRAIHLAPGAPDIDVYIASDTASFYGLAYGSASAVSSLPPGTVRVRITDHNIPTPLLYDENITLEANRRRILLVFGTPGNIQVQNIALPLNAPAISGDSAAIRFVQASPDGGNVDIRIRDAYGNLTTLNGVSFKSNTVFRTIPRGMADIEVYAAGTSNRLLKVRNDFGASSRSTAFITGNVLGQPEPLKLQLVNEQSLSAQQPIRTLLAPTAQLRSVHLVPNAPAIDIYTGTDLAISNLAFLDASELISVSGGTYNVGVTATGTPLGSALLTTQLNLSEDSIYTATAVGDLTTPPSVMVLSRPALLSVSTDSVLLRIVHASAGAGNVDIRVDNAGEPLTLTNVGFKAATPYMKIPRGNVMVKVSQSGSSLAYVASGTLEGGSMVTLFVTGSGDDLQLNMLTDNLSNEQKPLATLTRVANSGLRAVHLTPDAPPVDIFLNDNGTSPVSLSFRQASGAIELNSGTANVKIAAAGTGIGASLLTRDIELPSDTLVTAFAVGTISTNTVDVITLKTAAQDAPQQGQVSVRLLHAAPDAGTVDVEFTPANGQPVRLNGFTFKSSTPYMIVPPGTGKVRIFAPGSQTPLLSVQGDLPADAIVTAIVTGTNAQSNLGVNLLIDSRDQEQKPLILLAATPSSSVDFDRNGSGFSIAPNPAYGAARISYSLKNAASVRLSLYNQIGELVAISDLGAQDAGSYSNTLSTAILPAGVYNAVLTGNDGTTIGTQKLVVVK